MDTDYLETYFEVASVVCDLDMCQGDKYELCKAITDKFEEKYKDYTFDGDFLDLLDQMITDTIKTDKDEIMVHVLIERLKQM